MNYSYLPQKVTRCYNIYDKTRIHCYSKNTIIILLVGFMSYGGEIHDTIKRSNKLTWLDVITDTNICRLKNRKSFIHYLKVVLGVKL
jgi:hypothetical protein